MKRCLQLGFALLIFITLLPQNLSAQAEFSNGIIDVVMNDYGRIRIYDTVSEVKQVERFSILAAGAENEVYDYQKDADTEVPGILVDNPTLSDYEVSLITNNQYENAPPNYLIDINIYGWDGASYVLVKYKVTNNEAEAIDAYLGAELITAIDNTYGGEVATYDDGTNTVIYTRDGATTAIGVHPLSHDLVTLNTIDWFDNYYASDTALYAWLTAGTVQNVMDQLPNGPVTFFGFGTVNIPAGDSHSFWMAVALGADADAVNASITEAAANYATILTSVEQIDAVPTEYSLSQNYPNPFNPTTKINFSIPQSEFVTLKVYNSLGEEVANLVSEELDAGTYSVDFNAETLASGFYMYQLTSGNFTLTKKMMLVK